MKVSKSGSLDSGVRRITVISFLILLTVIISLTFSGIATAAGPAISDLESPTHPDPDIWYANHNPSFNWSVLGSLSLAGTYNTSGHAYAVAMSGSYAFVADYESGMQIVNVSNPASPTLAGSYDTAGNATDLVVSGNYAYIADGADGLVVVDISNPASPTLAGSYDTPGDARGVAISGNHAYVADDGGVGLQIIDISDPANPAFTAGYDTTGIAYGVAISGNHAYVADATSGLQVVNISNPTSPVLEGTYDTAGYAYDVSVAGTIACVADGVVGLQIIDISDPANPALMSTYDTPATSLGLDVTGNHAYVADQTSGLQIVDITDPAHPSLAGSYNTPGYAEDVVVAGSYIYVADYASGLQIVRQNGVTGYSYVLDQAAATLPDTTVDGTGASVSYTGVADGEWYFHVRAKDSTGAWGTASHLRIRIGGQCSGAAPALTLSMTRAYWPSYAEYSAGRLSVDFLIDNASSPDAKSVAVTDAVNTNSVTLATALPLAVGDIATGANSGLTLVYNIPGSNPPVFKTSLHGSAQDACGSSFTYPAS